MVQVARTVLVVIAVLVALALAGTSDYREEQRYQAAIREQMEQADQQVGGMR